MPENKLRTSWDTGGMPLPEYPRPQLRRDDYTILNGLWDYAITDTKEEPDTYDGHILVPYSPETQASLVGRVLEPEMYLHYRRLFTLRSLPKGADDEEGLRQVLTEKQTRKLLKKYKVLVPKKRNYYIETLASHYQHTHDIRQMDTARELIARQCPEYLESFDRVMGQKGGYMFNMFIAPEPLMDDYCQWLFAILFPLVDQLGDEGMTAFEKRYPGRVSEILWNVYLDRLVSTGELKREEIHPIPYMYFGKIDWPRKVKAFLGAKFLHRKYDASF